MHYTLYGESIHPVTTKVQPSFLTQFPAMLIIVKDWGVFQDKKLKEWS
jgi:hypothetical protein